MVRPEEASLIGRTVAGKFAIEAHIGSGAMGQVFRARQVALDKVVALKVLHVELAGDETFAARFQREAMAASRLDHVNSMRVIDFGTEPDGMLYIAMEFLDGRDLHRVIYEEWPFPERRSVEILNQALSALIVAHDMGVVHRDLKPENIMILEAIDDEGHPADLVKVCDFGIAKINNTKTFSGKVAAHGPLTTQGLVVGTPEYMSPEQGRGDPLDARSDLYSVGVILFQLLTGQVPFQSETALGLVFKQVNEKPPRPASIRGDVDPRLEFVCLKALAKDPADRFQTAREMRTALRAAFGTDGKHNASGPMLTPVQRVRDSAFGRAETLPLPSSHPSSGVATATTSQVLPLRTASQALPPLPISRPNVWLMGGLAIFVGATITGLGLTRFAPSSRSSLASDAPASASASAPRSVPESSPTTVAPLASLAASSLPASSAARPAGPAVGSATGVAGQAGGSRPPKPTPAPSSVTPRPAASAINLATSAASPSVTKATGVSPHDVRAAVPSWVLTQCYRAALEKEGKPLEGHLTLTLTIDGTGNISMVNVLGPGPLFQATGSCMVEAVRHSTVSNVAASGGSAEVDVDCTPR